MKRKTIILLLSLLILLTGCDKEKEKEKEESKTETKNVEVVIKEDLKLEINTEVYNTDLIKEVKNGQISSEKEEIDTTKLGKQTITIELISEEDKNEAKEIEIEIVDTIAPEIEANSSFKTTEGTKIDLLKGVKVTDNSKEDITPTIEGNYSISNPGEYKLKIIAEDSSGNVSKKDITLTVEKKAEEPKPVEPEQPKTTTEGTFTTSKGFSGKTVNGITYIDGIMIVNKTYSLPQSYNPGGLTSETLNAANEMFAAAKLEGYNMWAQSGFRSYETQSKLYNNYVSRDGKAAADRYSARPGHSEHQSGLAFDVCLNGYGCINSTFDDTPPAKWLSANAYKYGFILRFPKGKENETGYMYESWHFRYVGKELASKLYNNGNWITLESYFGVDSSY